MRATTAALPSGSHVALSHFFHPGEEDPEAAELAARLEESFLSSPMDTGRFHSRAAIAELLEPVLVVLGDGWPEGPKTGPRDPVRRLMAGPLARKP